MPITIQQRSQTERLTRDRDAYEARRLGQSWQHIVTQYGFNNESSARLAANRYATTFGMPALTTPNPRRSEAGRVAALARFNRPQTTVNRILNRNAPQVPTRRTRAMSATQERTYGVEIEYVNMARQTVALAVATALGVPHIHVVPYHGNICEECRQHIGPSYGQWKVERDGSVSTGGEVVSPILYGEEGFKQIEKVSRAIRIAGGGINVKCGLHIHLGVKDLSPQQRANLLTKWYATMPSIKKFVSKNRWRNMYCSQPTTIELNDWKTKILAGNDPEKHQAVRTRSMNITNFRKTGTYEVRLHQGSLNPKKINTWIKFLLAFVEFASQDQDLENPTNEEFGYLDGLSKPFAAKKNYFTTTEVNYLKKRQQVLERTN